MKANKLFQSLLDVNRFETETGAASRRCTIFL